MPPPCAPPAAYRALPTTFRADAATAYLRGTSATWHLPPGNATTPLHTHHTARPAHLPSYERSSPRATSRTAYHGEQRPSGHLARRGLRHAHHLGLPCYRYRTAAITCPRQPIPVLHRISLWHGRRRIPGCTTGCGTLHHTRAAHRTPHTAADITTAHPLCKERGSGFVWLPCPVFWILCRFGHFYCARPFTLRAWTSRHFMSSLSHINYHTHLPIPWHDVTYLYWWDTALHAPHAHGLRVYFVGIPASFIGAQYPPPPTTPLHLLPSFCYILRADASRGCSINIAGTGWMPTARTQGGGTAPHLRARTCRHRTQAHTRTHPPPPPMPAWPFCKMDGFFCLSSSACHFYPLPSCHRLYPTSVHA